MARPSGIGARILRKPFSGFVQGSAPDVERDGERREGRRGGEGEGGKEAGTSVGKKINSCSEGARQKSISDTTILKRLKIHTNPRGRIYVRIRQNKYPATISSTSQHLT